jgi:hypothetical protein
VVRRIVHQPNFQAGPVGELDHAFEKLRSRARVLRTVVEINHQSPQVWIRGLNALPPGAQAIGPEIACFALSEQKCQGTRGENENAERYQFFLGGRVVIPALGDFACGISSAFSPPRRIRLTRLSFLCPPKSPSFPHRLSPPREPPARWQRWHRCALSSSAACLSEYA